MEVFLTCVFLLIVFRLRTILRNFGWRRVITTEEYTSSLQMVQILHKLAVVIFFLKAHTWSVGFCLLLFNKWLGVIISIFSINFVYFFFFVEIDLHKGSDENFVQEYIANPYLIDKRKFDIGVYTVLTSIDPLRVYVYDQEVLIRLFYESLI